MISWCLLAISRQPLSLPTSHLATATLKSYIRPGEIASCENAVASPV